MFRFEELEIWQRSCDVGIALCEIADTLDKKRLHRFAEQLRAAALSISNNIAEGSGSASKAEFKNFLNYSRRSAFECANMIVIFSKKGYLLDDQRDKSLKELDEICRMIYAFRKSL